MNKITRRQFISQLLISLGSATSLNSLALASEQFLPGDTNPNQSSLTTECAVVYREWIRRESVSPTEYLASTMDDYNLEIWKISEAIKQDFQHNKFFEIEGLNLSKTEASFLAILGGELST